MRLGCTLVVRTGTWNRLDLVKFPLRDLQREAVSRGMIGCGDKRR